MAIKLRAHHVLCSIGFQGYGYDDPFTTNMSRLVIGTLRAPQGEQETILITNNADSICAPCPKRVGLGCQSQDIIDRLDTNHAEALGLKAGQRITWGEALDLVADRIKPEDLDELCTGCQWLASGMCKSAVSDLKATRTQASGRAA